MTPETLAAIRARLQAATPGPWWANGFEVESSHVRIAELSGEGKPEKTVPDPYKDGKDRFVLHDDGTTTLLGSTISSYADVSYDESLANAEFIANAPTDIAALLDEIEHLQRAYSSYVKATEEIDSNLADVINAWRERVVNLEKEIAALKQSAARGGRIFPLEGEGV